MQKVGEKKHTPRQILPKNTFKKGIQEGRNRLNINDVLKSHYKHKVQVLPAMPKGPTLKAGGSLTTTECGHLRPQTPVKDSGSLMTTKCGHLRPQNLIFTDRANKTSTVHGVTCDHRMRSLTTTKRFHNRTTEGGGLGGGGVGGMITYLGCTQTRRKVVWSPGDNVPWLAHRHAERWSGLPALGLHTCWPILVGGGGVGGMIPYLGLHTLVYRLWACTHAGPFWWVGVGWVG